MVISAARRRPLVLVCVLAMVLGGAAVVVASAPAARAVTAAPVPDATEVLTPAVSSLSPGRVDVFTRSSRGTLQYQYLPVGGSWTALRDLGGSIASQPSVVSWATGRFDVFARGADGSLQHRWFSGSRWSGWENLGGSLRSAPSAVSWGPGRLHVFSRGSDDALWYRSFNSGGGWSGWVRVGGILTASPAAAAWEPGRLDVFVRATDGTLRHAWFAGAWSRFENFGGLLSAQPAAASVGVGRLDVAVRFPDNTMWVKSFSRTTGWSGFVNRNGIFTSGPDASAAGGELLLAGRGSPGGHYIGRVSAAGSWGGWRVIDSYLPVRRLASWVDTLDYSLDPRTSVAHMHALGVRTLYLSTARFNSASDFYDVGKAGRWLDEAHRLGIKVVGWYVPAYGDMERDFRRTLAIATYVSPGGQRFDAVGVDIERYGSEGEVDLATFNSRLVVHLQRVRAASAAVLVSIVPPPYATQPSPQILHPRWEGFPWQSVAAHSDVVVPMTLWSNRANYSADQVYGWVLQQIRDTMRLTSNRVPVAVEGGVGSSGTQTPVTVDRMHRFVDAVRDGRALGGSHYDYLTTKDAAALWPPLRRLNEL